MTKILKTLIVIIALGVSACATSIPQEALELRKESLQLRQLQTRRFDTSNEKALLSASAAVLQDLGFNIDESETHLGVIVGSKDRSARDGGQIAGAVAMAVLFGANMPIDDKQKIRASIVTRPIGKKSTNVRVTFQRIVWNNQGQVSKTESVEDEEIYRQFFDKLSKSIFLNANQI